MQWLNIFYCFINYHFGFIYFLKIANWRQKGKYKNNSAIFLSPKMLQPIILETTLNFIFGLQLSSKWSPNGLLFTSKVVSIWSPMETFSSLPISSQPCYFSSITPKIASSILTLSAIRHLYQFLTFVEPQKHKKNMILNNLANFRPPWGKENGYCGHI